MVVCVQIPHVFVLMVTLAVTAKMQEQVVQAVVLNVYTRNDVV